MYEIHADDEGRWVLYQTGSGAFQVMAWFADREDAEFTKVIFEAREPTESSSTNQLTEFLKGRSQKEFRVAPFYSKEGDFLTVFFRDADHYAERIDDRLTVYYSMEKDDLVGCKIKWVTRFL